MFNLKTKGQSTLEYVILIGFVVAALIAMGVYMKRGVQGKLRESTDQIGEQYSAGITVGKATVKIDQSQNEHLEGSGITTVTINKDEKRKLSGAYETTTGLDTEE